MSVNPNENKNENQRIMKCSYTTHSYHLWEGGLFALIGTPFFIPDEPKYDILRICVLCVGITLTIFSYLLYPKKH